LKPSPFAGLSALLFVAGAAVAAPPKTAAPTPTAPAPKPAAKPAPKPKLPAGVVATVNGTPITAKLIDARLWRKGGQSETDTEVNKTIVRLEAKKRGIKITKAQVQQEYDLQKQKFISSPGRQPGDWDKFVERYGKPDLMDDMEIQVLATRIGEAEAAKAKLTPAEVKAADDQVERESNQVHARHILVGIGDQFGGRTDADAQKRIAEVQAKLKAGGKWEDLAKEYSDDSTNKDRGGDLGFFSHGQMVPEFENAAFSMKKDEITPNAVKTQFGYHLIQVLEVKNTPVTAADKKKSEDEALKRKRESAKSPGVWFQKLRASYKIQTRMPFE
jgi:foldase protein PrsA